MYGGAVSTAGDVNGDGFADVIVGADPWSSPGAAEGGAFWVYHGNGADTPGVGLDRIPRQARADGSAPIDTLGLSATADGFRLRANGRHESAGV